MFTPSPSWWKTWRSELYLLVWCHKELFVFCTFEIICSQFDQERSPMQSLLGWNSMIPAMKKNHEQAFNLHHITILWRIMQENTSLHIHRKFGSTQFPSLDKLSTRYLKVHTHTKRKEKKEWKKIMKIIKTEDEERKKRKNEQIMK